MAAYNNSNSNSMTFNYDGDRENARFGDHESRTGVRESEGGDVSYVEGNYNESMTHDIVDNMDIHNCNSIRPVAALTTHFNMPGAHSNSSTFGDGFGHRESNTTLACQWNPHMAAGLFWNQSDINQEIRDVVNPTETRIVQGVNCHNSIESAPMDVMAEAAMDTSFLGMAGREVAAIHKQSPDSDLLFDIIMANGFDCINSYENAGNHQTQDLHSRTPFAAENRQTNPIARSSPSTPGPSGQSDDGHLPVYSNHCQNAPHGFVDVAENHLRVIEDSMPTDDPSGASLNFIFDSARTAGFGHLQETTSPSEGYSTSESGLFSTCSAAFETLEAPPVDCTPRRSVLSLQGGHTNMSSQWNSPAGESDQQLHHSTGTELQTQAMVTAPTVPSNGTSSYKFDNKVAITKMPTDHPQTKPRGRRRGALEAVKRAAACEIRKTKGVCIGCKRGKTACKTERDQDICQSCMTKSIGLCEPASFFHVVKDRSIHTIGQEFIFHVSSDMSTYSHLNLPPEVNLTTLIDELASLNRGSGYTFIRVLHGNDFLCDLDLMACMVYLTGMSNSHPKPMPFLKFVNGLKLKKEDNCRSCFRNHESLLSTPNLEVYQLIEWTDMPSRVTYSLVSKDDRTGRALNPQDHVDLRRIHAAAQLFTIATRKLELIVYSHLQRLLEQNEDQEGAYESYEALGSLLLSLRRKANWLQLMRNNMDENARSDGDYGLLITKLLSTLYAYHLADRCKLKSKHRDAFSMRGQNFEYPMIGSKGEESFPSVDSGIGFQKWMNEGLAHVHHIEAQLRETGLL